MSSLSKRRKAYDRSLRTLLYLCAGITCALLLFLIGYIFYRGLGNISWELLSSQTSYINDTIGILPNFLNTLYIILLAMVIVLPLGVGAAIYLTEYATNRKVVAAIEFATQESLKTVPQSYREGALALGAGKWHMVRTVVLPNAVDGIVTGCILAVGRIVGESAALLFTAGFGLELNNFITSLQASSATLTVALYVYANERGETGVAFAIAAVLMLLVFLINFAATLAGKKLKRKAG